MIITAMIVEDEEWVRNGLIKKVQRVAPDIKICSEAADGQELLKILKRTKPDILVTDIKLPVMDGIQLIKEAKSTLPYLKIIIVSGFAEFELAQQAIALGVSGYIIKPVSESDLAALLTKVTQEITCASCNTDGPALPVNIIACINSCIANNRMDMLHGIVAELFSEQKIDLNNLLHIELTLKQITKCIENALLDAGFTPLDTQMLVQKMLKHIPSAGRQYTGVWSYIHAELSQYVEKTISEGYVIKNVASGIAKYIDRNYSREMTLEYFAEKYKVDMSYLSRQFKRINGVNLSEYVINKRLEESKSLLVNTQLSISEICDSVGFGDISYFYRVFKKKMLVTPSQFRECHRCPNT